MKTILFTNVRDEPHLNEWVGHHLSLGFTTVYIYDHLSKKPIQSSNPNVVVERLNTPFANKTWLMNRAAIYARSQKYDWMIYLDGDEMLFLREHDTVESFLTSYGDGIHQIGLNWLIFGSNYLEEKPDFLLPSYTRCLPTLHKEVKVFVRPGMVDTGRIPSPHFFHLRGGGRSVGWDMGKLEGPLYVDKSGMDFSLSNAYVAHYIVQAYEVYRQRKLQRSRDDLPGEKWKEIPREKFHNQFNQVVNTEVADRYAGCIAHDQYVTELAEYENRVIPPPPRPRPLINYYSLVGRK